MSSLMLRLFEDELPAHCPPVYLPAAPRALYLAQGEATAEDAVSGTLLLQGAAWVGEDALTLNIGAAPVRIWRWELSTHAAAAPGLPSAPATRTVLKLEAPVELDPGFDWLMRCDEVGFPPGGVALTHVHQGPGIRICAEGEIGIETQGRAQRHGPGQAWFELGPAPVLAPTTEREPTRFVRCFLLPRQLKGRSSIRYVRQEDADAPKVQTYRVFAERYIRLPQ